MMECQECGNRESFYYEVEGTEEMRFDPETGELVTVEVVETEAIGGRWCGECDSTHVIHL